ncbi:MAG: hypothetical protein OXT49_07805 [Gammaproteobacteria bacterium]|nr:hypothetical protein [Gammaproteobacteria bacterium]
MKLILSTWVALLALSIPFSAGAETQTKCEKNLTKTQYLPEVRKSAERAKDEICSAEDQASRNLIYVNFIHELGEWFIPYGGLENSNAITTVDAFKKKITITIPTVTVDSTADLELQIGDEYFKPMDEEKCTEASGATSCFLVIQDFIKIHQDIASLVNDSQLATTSKKLKSLRAQWKPFLEQMKGQTAWELLANRCIYKNNTDSFSAPPDSQLVLMHPTLLIENVSAAADGDSIEEALGLEIVGINWWRQDKWYIPSGVSLLAVYSDRAGIDDTGYGLAVHFLSEYTFGYTNRGGEDGYFVSMDVIKLFQNKKKAFDSYYEPYKKHSANNTLTLIKDELRP